MMPIVANRRLLALVVFALVLAPASFVWFTNDAGNQLLGQLPPADPPPAEGDGPPPPTCGNGLCQPGESNETCPDDCPATTCGNGVCEPNEITTCAEDCAGSEECDDGNSDDGDGCSAACTIEVPVPVCGDGEVTEPETCDDGNSASGDGCSATCEEEVCGNSIVEFDDVDGNGEPGEGEQGEQCDDGNTDNGDGCTEDCQMEFCGDGTVQEAPLGADPEATGEECDDGNEEDGDGCSSTCRIERCGNGKLDANEECDDANNADEDGCNKNCMKEFCGDGTTQASLGEECDVGSTCVIGGEQDDSFDCRNSSECNACIEVPGTTTKRCGGSGNGLDCTDDETVCEDSSYTCEVSVSEECTPECTRGPGEGTCGNGELEGTEECDDGNSADGDGCSKSCLKEFCGDGEVTEDIGEQCDNGGVCSQNPSKACRNADECSGCLRISGTAVSRCGGDPNGTLCQNDEQCEGSGYTCEYDTEEDPICNDQCEYIGECGNGEVEGEEECDDGNAADQDGCSRSCETEFCGDGEVQEGMGELCDNGKTCSQNASISCGVDGDCRGCLPIRNTSGVIINNQKRCGGDPRGVQCDTDAECANSPYTCQYDDDNPGCDDECQLTEFCEEDSDCPEGEVCIDGECNALCGNGEIDTGEDCDDGNTEDDDECSADCRNVCEDDDDCPDGQICIDDECVESCGDGEVDSGETCLNCPDDAGCGNGTQCCEDGTCAADCIDDPECNEDGTCDKGESCECDDCDGEQDSCSTGLICEDKVCTGDCGNGEVDDDETCLTCPDDAGCGQGQICCQDGSCSDECEPVECNEDGTCDANEDCACSDCEETDVCLGCNQDDTCQVGENCECPDCDGKQDGCAQGFVCVDEVCTGDECGNGDVDDGETCLTCPDDAGCGNGTQCCADGTCAADCVDDPACNNDDTCDVGESCSCDDCQGEQDSCLPGLICIGDTCSEDCGNGDVDDGETCLTCPDDAGCGNGTQCCADGTCAADCVQDPECDEDNKCETGESCACPDCDGEQDSCLPGLVCVDEECSDDCGNGKKDRGETCLTCPNDAGCGDGTQCCADGTCAEECVDQPDCNEDGICDRGENCECPDCLGEQDSCRPKHFCDEDGLCHPSTCGNGTKEEGEECDDDNSVDGDGCSKVCLNEFCGDGEIQPTLGEEVCDNGSACRIRGTLVSSFDCRTDTDCQVCLRISGTTVSRCGGDGYGKICKTDTQCAGTPYTCEYNTARAANCDENCQSAIGFCGNEVIEGAEECDDGNNGDGDGCSKTCLKEFCGDGKVLTPEQCDNGSVCDNNSAVTCRTDAQCRLCKRISGTSVSRCGGDPYGAVCTTDASCTTAPYTCVYDATEDAKCNAACESLGDCGNGRKERNETCLTCPDDAGCGSGTQCCADGTCKADCVSDPPCNNNNTCDVGESCACADCDGERDSCSVGLICKDDVCYGNCGNGDLDTGETCLTCPADAGCGSGTQCCADGTCADNCVDDPDCDNDDTCDVGESCACPDCDGKQDGCQAGLICEDDVCEDKCGNGTKDSGETCLTCPDDAGCGSGTQCCADGTCAAECDEQPDCNENGICDAGENCECADCLGEQDSCRPNHFCAADGLCHPSTCGNGTLEVGEECDDNNSADGDGCSKICLREFCGDGEIQSTLNEEVCDNGSACLIGGKLISSFDCRKDADCHICLRISGTTVSRCGGDAHGTICTTDAQCTSSAYTCKYNTLRNASCSENCKNGTGLCGNSIIEGVEECDDGNNGDGDGCSKTCLKEFCGDGIVIQPEQCDNGNVCSNNSAVTCRTDAQCRLCKRISGTSVSRCGGDPFGVLCTTDASCTTAPYTCVYDVIENTKCNASCQSLGDCGNKKKDTGETCLTCPNDAGCGNGNQCCADGTCAVDCQVDPGCDNDRICDVGESCACPDCDGKQDSCLAGLVCIGDKCSDKCGNGTKDPGETCLNCPHDAGCGNGTQCCADGTCAADCPIDPPCNNNSVCDVGESCACADCDGKQDSCLVGLVCEDDLCEGNCGNGKKDTGETCLTCPNDAGCGNGTQCCADGTCAVDCPIDPPCDNDSTCDVGESCACADCDGKQDSCLTGLVCENDHCSDECGDGSLDPGETCLTCPHDAGCAAGTQCCADGTCKADCPIDPPCNNNNTCDVGESCACPDCDGKQDSCRQGLVCEEEVCEGDCGNGTKDPGETCGTCAADAGCSQGQQCCSDGTCKADCGGNQQCDDDNICETGEGCGCDDCAGKQDGCQVGLICEDNHCEPDDDATTFCGNGRLELPAEECDDGNNVAADGCDRNCLLETLTPVCGDALIVAPEECDDGNQTSGDGCSPVCTVEQTLVQGICGDGSLNQGEQCDDSNQNNGDGCNTLCQLEPGTRTRCGDGILTAGEQCDDGNGVSGDGCSLSCRIESTAVRGNPLCGNGVRDAGEECDDGNTRDVDGCSATCFLEKGYCGDGVVQHALSEQCEPTTHDSSLPYGCKNDCRFALRFCGNERLDAGEECDLGTLNSDAPNSMCRKDCSRTRCGDSILDGGEMCDDGNVVSGDGCDRLCRREAGAFSGDTSQWPFGDPNSPFGPYGQLGNPYQYGQGQYPMYPNTQPLPYNLPLAQVATGNLNGGQGQIAGDTGPVAVSVMAAGAAAGFAWMRRRRGL